MIGLERNLFVLVISAAYITVWRWFYQFPRADLGDCVLAKSVTSLFAAIIMCYISFGAVAIFDICWWVIEGYIAP